MDQKSMSIPPQSAKAVIATLTEAFPDIPPALQVAARHIIDHPSAWKASDFSSQDDYAFDLGPRHYEAFDAALEAAEQRARSAASCSGCSRYRPP